MLISSQMMMLMPALWSMAVQGCWEGPGAASWRWGGALVLLFA